MDAESSEDNPESKAATPAMNIHWLAIGYFALLTLIVFALFATKKEKGWRVFTWAA